MRKGRDLLFTILELHFLYIYYKTYNIIWVVKIGQMCQLKSIRSFRRVIKVETFHKQNIYGDKILALPLSVRFFAKKTKQTNNCKLSNCKHSRVYNISNCSGTTCFDCFLIVFFDIGKYTAQHQ